MKDTEIIELYCRCIWELLLLDCLSYSAMQRGCAGMCERYILESMADDPAATAKPISNILGKNHTKSVYQSFQMADRAEARKRPNGIGTERIGKLHSNARRYGTA